MCFIQNNITILKGSSSHKSYRGYFNNIIVYNGRINKFICSDPNNIVQHADGYILESECNETNGVYNPFYLEYAQSSVNITGDNHVYGNHYYDEDQCELIDIENENISINNLPHAPNGKKIKNVEILIRVASNNQKQKN